MTEAVAGRVILAAFYGYDTAGAEPYGSLLVLAASYLELPADEHQLAWFQILVA